MKKVLAIVLAVLAAATCFAGCGKSKETTEAKKQLVMGTNASFPPYEFVDDNNNIVGIDAEIAKALADKLGMELTIKDMEFDSLIPAVKGGSIDVVLAGMTVTDERKESVNFSDSYATGIQSIIVKDSSEIKNADQLKNAKKIGVQTGTTGDIYCTDDFGKDKVNQYANGSLAVAALKNDQVDAVVIDNEPAKNYVKANTGLKILDTEYAVEDYAIAVSKDNQQLLDDINKALKELTDSGKIKEIVDKYITAE